MHVAANAQPSPVLSANLTGDTTWSAGAAHGTARKSPPTAAAATVAGVPEAGDGSTLAATAGVPAWQAAAVAADLPESGVSPAGGLAQQAASWAFVGGPATPAAAAVWAAGGGAGTGSGSCTADESHDNAHACKPTTPIGLIACGTGAQTKEPHRLRHQLL